MLTPPYQKAIHREAFDALVTSGLQLRIDDVGTSLWHVAQRVRMEGCFEGMSPCNQHDSSVRNAAAYVEANVIPAEWLHVFPGFASTVTAGPSPITLSEARGPTGSYGSGSRHSLRP